MKVPAISVDRRAVLQKLVRELTKAKSDASAAGLDMLAYLLAMALDEAETALKNLGGDD
jgi:hypothetical protein